MKNIMFIGKVDHDPFDYTLVQVKEIIITILSAFNINYDNVLIDEPRNEINISIQADGDVSRLHKIWTDLQKEYLKDPYCYIQTKWKEHRLVRPLIGDTEVWVTDYYELKEI